MLEKSVGVACTELSLVVNSYCSINKNNLPRFYKHWRQREKIILKFPQLSLNNWMHLRIRLL